MSLTSQTAKEMNPKKFISEIRSSSQTGHLEINYRTSANGKSKKGSIR